MRLDIPRSEKAERIRTLPDELERSLAVLDDGGLDMPYRPGGWTPRQVAHHLADAHMNAYIRVKLLLTEKDPLLKTWEQDAWAALPDARTEPVDSALGILRGVHKRWAATFDALDEAEWSRTGRHPEQGTITVSDLLDYFAWHGRHHVEQIERLRDSYAG